MKSLFLFLILLNFFSEGAWAERYIPRLMNASERKTALQILGFGSASKIIANPYALGGHQGAEIGISSEYIPVHDLGSLGDKSSHRSELNYFSLSVAKGLYYDVDTAIHFTPAFQKEDLASFGGQVRWGFYEFQFMPGNLSIVGHGSATSFASLIDTRTTGFDFIATFVVEDVALYVGGGEGRTIGTFVGGTETATAFGTVTESTTSICNNGECETAYEDLSSSHTVFGISLSFADLFAAFQIDRYYLPTYSAKLGWRF